MTLPLPVVRAVISATLRPLLGPPVPLRFQRAAVDALSRGNRLRPGTTTTPVVLGGCPAVRVSADGADRGAVLWAHGGAFITGSPVQARSFASHLSAAAGAPVYLLDYRLAPEHNYRDQVTDLQRALLDVPTEQVVLGGDSAGGCLALLAALDPSRRLAGLALISPVVDLTLVSSAAWTGKELVVRNAWARRGVEAAFGDDRPDLVGADVSGLPPTVIHVSGEERLRPEGEALAARIPGAELVLLLGLWHDVHMQCGLLKESESATAQLGRSIASFLNSSPP